MIRFEVQPHSTRHGETMIEVWRGMGDYAEHFVGALYPEAEGVKFVSAYEGMVRAEIDSLPIAGRRLRVVDIEIGPKRL